MDTAEAGKKGGLNSRKNLPPGEATRLAKEAAGARWKNHKPKPKRKK